MLGTGKYFAIIALGALTLSVAFGALQTWRITGLEVENTRLQTSLETYRAVARVRKESQIKALRAKGAAERREALATEQMESLIEEMENANVSVDPRVSEFLRCLQQGRRDCSSDP